MFKKRIAEQIAILDRAQSVGSFNGLLRLAEPERLIRLPTRPARPTRTTEWGANAGLAKLARLGKCTGLPGRGLALALTLALTETLAWALTWALTSTLAEALTWTQTLAWPLTALAQTLT